jgi:methylmalonyl-CoA/ethylmalonyl-CoA epimerase
MKNIKVNHIGMVVPNIEAFLEGNAILYGAFRQSALIVNTVQQVKEMFISDGRVVIELLEPIGEGSPISGFLRRNRYGGLIHVGFNVSDLDSALLGIEAAGGKVIVSPVADPGFDGRRIAFVVLNGQVTELIECGLGDRR